MKIKILDIIDFEKVNILLEGFNKSTGFVTAILDLDGNVLSKSGWRKICTGFHRINPETAKKCTISDTELAGKIAEGEKYHFYKCLNGLVDVALPIVIKGEHIANLFSGQFFFEEPNRAFFTKQAKKYGFNEKEYLEALGKVPIVSKEEVLTAMEFLLNMTQLISEMTFQKLEQKELNRALTDSEERFQLLFNQAPLGYQSLDFDGNFIEVNQQWLNTLGYERNEVIGKWFGSFLVLDNQDGFRKRFQIFKAQGHIQSEFEMVHKNGSVLFIAFDGKIVYNLQGNFKQTHCILQDITERHKAEKGIQEWQTKLKEALEVSNQSRKTLLSVLEDQQHAQQEVHKLNAELESKVEQRTAQLEASNKELEAFSYSVSHDLRAPLRHISGFADMLTKDIQNQLSEKERHYLQIINESANKMGELIDDLLSFSRTGRTEIKHTTFSMNQVIEDAKTQLKHLTPDRVINWKIATLPNVYGDYNLVRLAWVNLIDNALKYTRNRKKAVITIDWKEDNEEYIFWISDNGVGFDMNYAQKLFGVFQRMHSSSEFEGTGIGLANVNRIILKHGGRIWAEAKVNKGATFYFSLPKVRK